MDISKMIKGAMYITFVASPFLIGGLALAVKDARDIRSDFMKCADRDKSGDLSMEELRDAYKRADKKFEPIEFSAGVYGFSTLGYDGMEKVIASHEVEARRK